MTEKQEQIYNAAKNTFNHWFKWKQEAALDFMYGYKEEKEEPDKTDANKAMMERLTKRCRNTEDGKYIPYVVGDFSGIYPDCTLGKVVERLAYYEDLKEQGRLFILDIEDIHPCKGCDTGWGYVSSSGSHVCQETCEKLKQYNEKYKL